MLRYIDENDRAYGIAGMTIAMVLWDGESYLASVGLDTPVGSSIEFTPAFGFCGNPRLMASLAWRENMKQFELTTAMVMSNAICRSYVLARTQLDANTSKQLHDYVREEGRDRYSLEDDEVDIVYNKTRRTLDRVFTHPGVLGLVRNFANTLQQRRRLSASEVLDILSALNNM